MAELGIKVKDVAEHIIKINSPYYSAELLGLIPDEILNIPLSDENLHNTSVLIDERLMFPKQHEFGAALGLTKNILYDESDIQIISSALNSKRGSLSEPLEKIRKEIKFLSSVSATVLHQ